MVPKRRRSARRALLDGNFARRKLPLREREYCIWDTELAKLRSSDDRTKQCAGVAITLLLLTGCRKSEILTLEWSDIKGNRLHLRDSKTGPRTVWLGSAAREVIAALPRYERIPYPFWNYSYRKPLRCVNGFWRRLRDEARLPGVRIHDLRHTFASHAAINKETLPMIGRLLGHANVQTTARYAHLDDGHLFEAVQQIGDLLECMLN